MRGSTIVKLHRWAGGPSSPLCNSPFAVQSVTVRKYDIGSPFEAVAVLMMSKSQETMKEMTTAYLLVFASFVFVPMSLMLGFSSW